ncbi:hypothetical protein Tco_1018258 [Tanacetum coccineum]|uniref:Uncharacterized protein n=1 Tax=Tanacetum coccineum TaxID=301880 RepID=A0ABQ5FTT7_9ASTR
MGFRAKTAASRGGRISGRTGRGSGRTGEPTGRVGGQTGDQNGQGGDRESKDMRGFCGGLTRRASTLISYLRNSVRTMRCKSWKTEFWCHVMVRAGHAAYTDRLYELARLVPHLVTPDNKRTERHIYGLAPQIRVMVAATELTTI